MPTGLLSGDVQMLRQSTDRISNSEGIAPILLVDYAPNQCNQCGYAREIPAYVDVYICCYAMHVINIAD